MTSGDVTATSFADPTGHWGVGGPVWDWVRRPRSGRGVDGARRVALGSDGVLERIALAASLWPLPVRVATYWLGVSASSFSSTSFAKRGLLRTIVCSADYRPPPIDRFVGGPSQRSLERSLEVPLVRFALSLPTSLLLYKIYTLQRGPQTTKLYSRPYLYRAAVLYPTIDVVSKASLRALLLRSGRLALASLAARVATYYLRPVEIYQ